MLKGQKVTLRPLREDDIEPLFGGVADVMQMGAGWGVELRSLATTKSSYEKDGYWNEERGLLVIEDHSGKLLGHIIYFKDGMMAGYEIGYAILDPAERGKGYALDALRLFSAYLFDCKPIRRLQVCTVADNIASQKVALACGYQAEGVRRAFFYNRGRHVDMWVSSLLREECPPLRTINGAGAASPASNA